MRLHSSFEPEHRALSTRRHIPHSRLRFLLFATVPFPPAFEFSVVCILSVCTSLFLTKNGIHVCSCTSSRTQTDALGKRQRRHLAYRHTGHQSASIGTVMSRSCFRTSAASSPKHGLSNFKAFLTLGATSTHDEQRDDSMRMLTCSA